MKTNIMKLAKGISYSLDTYETGRNNNVLIVGASGTGKTRSIIIPNLLQATGSYIIADPKGNLYHRYGQHLQKRGYKVRMLDLVHPERSIGYNIFRYIRNEMDIHRIAHMLVFQNGGSQYDPFWDYAAEILLETVIGYVYYMAPAEEQNLNTVLMMIEEMQVKPEGKCDRVDVVDLLFQELEERDPQSFPVRKYHQLRTVFAADRTYSCILMEAVSRIGHLSAAELQALLVKDETDITSVGKVKTALFVSVSDNDRSMDVLANLFFSQAMSELCRVADELPESRLPVPVRFFLDDFATNVRINEFPRMISSIRSREISVVLVIQAESQLSASYGEEGKTIIMNCDTYVFLGGSDLETVTAVAGRADTAPQFVLKMPLGKCFILRRGEEARMAHLLVTSQPDMKESKLRIGFAAGD